MKIDAKYPMFEYRVTIGKHSTSYSTGIGWVTPKREEGTSIFQVPSEYNHFFSKYSKFGPTVVYRKIPKPSDVAECLLSDIDAGSSSFNDFCDNFGLSNDSLKALDTYRAFMDTATKFKKADLITYLNDQQKEDLGLNQ
jgi:hypothetical protein